MMWRMRRAWMSVFGLMVLSAFVAAGCLTLGEGKAGADADQGKPVAKWVDPRKETKEQRDARMGWWRDAKFGMFIHWGVYAVPAGEYHGKPVRGIGEWIMNRGKIPCAEYRAFAKKFNPVKYDPDAWVRLAKEAGMKYIVITSKHHDGFALFDSKVTDWDVVDATPYGKDLLRPLEKACKKYGIKLGFYYSQAQDWNHPGGAKAGYKEGGGWDEAHKGSFDEYLKKIAVPQVTEILKNYDISILWWDTPCWMNKERAEPLYELLKLKPGLITNNRLGGGFKGDLSTPEQHIPATGLNRDWETCMTMNNTWGYKKNDHNWKSVKTLLRNLVDIASKGGNFLLNVGPTAEGEIPQASVERLKAIGKWMKVNGESIYGTKASPFRKLAWGRCTRKPGGLYLHVFDWPSDGKLVVPGLRNKVLSAQLLATGAKLDFKRDGGNVVVKVPSKALDSIDTVVKLQIEGEPDIDPQFPTNQADGSIQMSIKDAYIDSRMRIVPFKKHFYIKSWRSTKASVIWEFENKRPGKYKVEISIRLPEVKARGNVVLVMSSGKTKVRRPLSNVELRKRVTMDFGTVQLPAGVRTVKLGRVVAKGKKRTWADVWVGDIRLIPVAK